MCGHRIAQTYVRKERARERENVIAREVEEETVFGLYWKWWWQSEQQTTIESQVLYVANGWGIQTRYFLLFLDSSLCLITHTYMLVCLKIILKVFGKLFAGKRDSLIRKFEYLVQIWMLWVFFFRFCSETIIRSFGERLHLIGSINALSISSCQSPIEGFIFV